MSRKRDIPSPTALPRDTWLGTFTRTVRGFQEDKLNHWGAALTYYAVLSLFPALLVLVSFIGLVANPARVTTILTDTVSQLGPSTAAKTFQGPIQSITANRGTAGVVFAVGILAALWAASGYVSAFSEACNTIYEVKEGRPFWKRKPRQLLVTFVLILLAALVALALVLSGPIVGALGSALGVSDTALNAWRFAKWPVLVILVLIIFGVLYYTSPNAGCPSARRQPNGDQRLRDRGSARKEPQMAKSARRNKTEGKLDKLVGRVLEAVGKLTGKRSAGAKGKAARGRGAARSTKGRLKRKGR
jgi:membrane protein